MPPRVPAETVIMQRGGEGGESHDRAHTGRLWLIRGAICYE